MKNERVEENLTRQLKNAIILLICLCLLPLGGCASDREERRLESFRASLEGSAVTVAAEVTARDGEDIDSFELRCTETDGGCDVEVLAPDSVAGVRAHTRSDGVEMEFEDLILPMPQDPDAVSPLLALPLVLSAARTGHLDLVWEEDGTVCQLIVRDGLAVRLYLNADNVPTAAEIDADGHTNVFCTITEWSTEKSDANESNDPNVGGDSP